MTTAVISLQSEPVQIQEIATYISRLRTLGEENKKDDALDEYRNLLKEKEYTRLLEKILSEADLIFEKGEELEIESLWCMFATLMFKLGSSVMVTVAPQLLETLQKVDDRRALRLAMLAQLYNLRDSNKWNYSVLEALLSFALASDQGEYILPILEGLTTRLSLMEATVEQQRSIYSLVLNCLKDKKEFREEYVLVLQAILATYSESESSLALPFLKEATALSFNAPGNLRAPMWLADVTVAKSLGDWFPQLLGIFASKLLSDWESFARQNASFLQDFGIDVDIVTEKMRILSIASLASGKSQLEYGEIVEAIGVPNEDVDLWLMKAIEVGIVDVLINASTKTIQVRHAEPRMLGEKELAAFEQRLGKVRSHIDGVLSTVSNGVIGPA